MSEDEWNGLRVGNIVIEKRSGTPRIVLGITPRVWKLGPKKGQPAPWIELRCLRRGWCDFTVLTPHDWRPRLDLVPDKQAHVTPPMLWCSVHGMWHFDRKLSLTEEMSRAAKGLGPDTNERT